MGIKMKKICGAIFGALLVAGGVLYALNVLGMTDIKFSLDGWWTLFIIVPSVSGIISGRDKSGGLIGLLIGVLLLLGARDIIDYDIVWQLTAPIIVVVIGVKLIIRAFSIKKPAVENGENDEYKPGFNAKIDNFEGKDLKIAKVGAVFGATTCNLTDAKFKEGSRVDVLCLFGGAEIVVPENVEVKVNALSIFGGISDKRPVRKETEKTAALTINGLCLFGGADIK